MRRLVATCALVTALPLGACGSGEERLGDAAAAQTSPATQAVSTITGEYRDELATICKRKGKSIRRWISQIDDVSIAQTGTLQTAAWLAARDLGKLIKALEGVPAPDPEAESAARAITERLDELRETQQTIADTIEQAALSGSPAQMQLQMESVITRVENVPIQTEALVEVAEQAGVEPCGIFKPRD